MIKNIKIKAILILSCCIIIVSLFSLTTILKKMFSSYVTLAECNIGTYEIIAELDKLIASMVDMENGQRGYTMTGDESFLESYKSGAETFDGTFEKLISATSDNQEQQESLQQIKELKDSWVEMAKEQISFREKVEAGEISFEEGGKREPPEYTKTHMEQICEVVSKCKEIENALLESRTKEQQELFSSTSNMLTVGNLVCSIIALCLVAALSYLISYRLKKVTKAAEKIAAGDFSVDLETKLNDEIGQVTTAFLSIKTTVKELVDEMNLLSQEAIAGNLNIRGNCDCVQGEYKAIVEGINKTLDEMTRPIGEAVEVLNEVKNGNLTIKMTGEYQGNHEQIKIAVNETVDSLHDVIGNINEIAEQVRNSSSQVAESSRTIAVGTTEQAGVVEEIAASVEEIASQTGKNAEKAEQAKIISRETSKLAEQGNERMNSMMQSMKLIEESSNHISSIIGVIQDIAAQTNMLSLNASIEAARAGEQGRGFAVVAEEVRELAERSAAATQESIKVINESLKNVEMGIQYAQVVNDSLENILKESEKSALLVEDISDFCVAQKTNVEEINIAIEQVSGVIQNNAALSEESTAESEVMNEQVVVLNQQVQQYKL